MKSIPDNDRHFSYSNHGYKLKVFALPAG